MVDFENKKRKFRITSFDLLNLNELKARDLIVKCFSHAHYQTFKHAKERLGSPTDVKSVQKSTASVVKMAFEKAGYDFDKPTKEALTFVLKMLAKESAVMGMPNDIIDYHMNEIMKVIDRLAK